jgi:hypothetical protein
MSDAKFDSRRRLCPDGACIGVIGDDGRCPVCGRNAGGSGKGPAGIVAASPSGSADADSFEDDDADPGESENENAKSAAGGFDPNRRLCPDGSCVGVIGADGVCTVCGQKAD